MATSDDFKLLRQNFKEGAWLWVPASVPVPLAGAIGLILYASSQDSLTVFSVSVLVACAAWISGGLLGFIFGHLPLDRGLPVGRGSLPSARRAY